MPEPDLQTGRPSRPRQPVLVNPHEPTARRLLADRQTEHVEAASEQSSYVIASIPEQFVATDRESSQVHPANARSARREYFESAGRRHGSIEENPS